ncbi:MAG: 3-methyl-2-oxobutanoate hydroxymethyltransferase [Deltaproteobacteria bacterium]|nr:3-methyl-2-oxobutanoate hydroxymethyltransferase [Deltaproteobacteria bacterium]MBI3296144.1 3-methyl-2-oxobutanoate hydroxymethyltransferase [Deltaproteobacteria bacterium]
METRRITISDIAQRKGQDPLVAITAYDYLTAKIVDSIVDIVLVGDSLGMVVQGHTDTLPVTLDHMVYHTTNVARALSRAHLVADMPFLTYQSDTPTAVRSAGRLLAEGRAQAVKLEGGTAMASTISKLVDVGIPVMGHIGLTPQSVNAMGGFRVQGRTAKARHSILEDAMAVEDAGAYSIVLEGIPTELAQEITQRLTIPTIGIGAGSSCDGQILVMPDMLGLNHDFKPKFVKHFADLQTTITNAVTHYAQEVTSRAFPAAEHTFYAKADPAKTGPVEVPRLDN